MQPRPPAHEPPGATLSGSPLAPGGPHPPETIRFTLEPFRTVVQGCTCRTEPTTLVAKRVPAAAAIPSPPLASPLPSEQASVIAAGTKAGSAYVFRRVGKPWKVIFACGGLFACGILWGRGISIACCTHQTKPSEHWVRVPLNPAAGENMGLDTDSTNGHGVLGSIRGNL
jgi:hypothetical protein